MSYRVVRTIKGRQYVYKQTSVRHGSKVSTKSTYLGPLVPVNQTGRGSFPNGVPLSRRSVRAAAESKGFARFVSSAETGFYPVAKLTRAARKNWPGVKRLELLLSATTKQKIIRKHPEVDLPVFRWIQMMIDEGEGFIDGKNGLVVFHHFDGDPWKLVAKCTRKGEPLLTTFHRSNQRQYEQQKGRLTTTLW